MKISFDSLNSSLKTLDPHVVTVGRGAAFFGAGLTIGLITKKYLRVLLLSLIICFFVIKGLEYKHVLNIDWGTLNQWLGLRPSTTLNDLAAIIYAWAATHPSESVPGGVGFFLGFTIG